MKTNYKNHHNAENLSKVTDCDLAWLAAMIEAEGSITATVHFRKTGNIVIVPVVLFTNKDELLVRKVQETMANLGITLNTSERHCKYNGEKVKMYNLSVNRMGMVKKVINYIYPHIHGAKKKNANVVLEFIEDREENMLSRDGLGRIVRNKYSRDQVINISSIRSHSNGHPLERMLEAPNIA